MPGHPLDGAYAKLDRADEHVRTLHCELKMLLKDKPLRVFFKFNAKSKWHIAYVRGADIPPRLSVIAGEIVFHDRSALEHLAWMLVKRNKKKPRKNNSFPIWERGNKEHFLRDTLRPRKGKQRAGTLYGVRHDAAALIEELQPYNASDPTRQVLAVLNRLARDDRHRTLHGSFIGTNPDDLQQLFIPHRGVEIVGFRTLLRERQSLLIEGTKIARFRIVPTSAEPQVQVEGQVPALVAFGDRKKVVPFFDFYKINESVRKVIDRFQRFF